MNQTTMHTRILVRGLRLFLIAVLLAGLAGIIGIAYAGDDGGKALDFGGTDEYVSIPDHSSLDMGTGSFTIEGWFKSDGALSQDAPLFHKGDTPPNNIAYGVRVLHTGGIRGGMQSYTPDLKTTFTTYNSGTQYDDGQWHHIAWVVDRTNDEQKMYVDGQQIGSTTDISGFTHNIDNSGIGNIGRQEGGESYAQATLDEIRVWKAALSQSNIQAWMHQEVTSSHPNWGNMVGYWKLNDGTGTPATDSKGSNNGTLQDMEEGDWVDSTAPIGNTTVAGQTDVTAMWASNTSASSSGLIIADAGFLQDTGDDIVFGHDGDTGTSNTYLTDIIVTVKHRWEREWVLDKCDVVGTANGNVQLKFDFGDAGRTTTPVADVNKYRLIKRVDSTSNFSIVATASSVSGDQVIFTVDASNLGSQFTLGTTEDSLGPNAIGLQSFTASAAGRVNGFGLPLALVALGAVGMLVLRWKRRKTHVEEA